MYSGNWFIFIWNDKVFWKKNTLFGFCFNRSPHIHFTTSYTDYSEIGVKSVIFMGSAEFN